MFMVAEVLSRNIYLEFAMSHLSLAYTFSSNIKPVGHSLPTGTIDSIAIDLGRYEPYEEQTSALT